MKPKTTILVMANSMVYQNQPSGGDKIFFELAKHLDSDSYNIHIVTTDIGARLWESGRKDEITVLRPSLFDRWPKRIFVPLQYLSRAIKARKIKVPDDGSPLVIYTSSDFLCDIIPASALRKKRHGDVWWVSRIYHLIPKPSRRKGNFFLNWLSYRGQRFSFSIIRKNSDIILALNPTLRRKLKAYGFAEEKTLLSGGGIDTEYISSVRKSQKGFDGVYLGRLHPNKGVFDLLDIWRAVVKEKPDASLAIIGGGDAAVEAAIKQRIASFQLDDNVALLGYIEKDSEIYGLMKASKVYLFTDHEGGWSLSTSEAMACGMPVVAYDLEIMGSVFKKGFRTVPLYDTRGFSREVLELLRDENERAELSTEAYEQSRLLGWGKIAEDFGDIIDKLICRNSKKDDSNGGGKNT